MTDFIAETTGVLERTPEVLRALLVGLPDAWTDAPDVADGWRPRDVVGHLITGEQTDWMLRTRRILEHGTEVRPWKEYLGILPRREDPSGVAG